MASVHSDPLPSSTPLPTPPPFSLPITPESVSRHYRRRSRSFCSSSSLSSPTSFSSFSSLSSATSYLSSPLACPSPSPTPLSSVPFSWEDQPGIPKSKHALDSKPANGTPIQPAGNRKGYPSTPNRSNSSSRKLDSNPPLRPPPTRSSSDHFGFPASFRWRRRLGLLGPGYVRDPFTVALIQCAKQHTPEEQDGVEEDDGDSDAATIKLLLERDSATPSSADTQQRRRRQALARKAPNGGNKFCGSCKTSCGVVETAAVLIPRLARPGGTKSYDLLRRRPSPTM